MTRTQWRNWSGSVRCAPARIARPRDTAEVVALVTGARERGGTVRPAGAGHSFTPLVRTDDVVVDLARMRGLVAVDHEAGTATVRAGTTLGEIGRRLWREGMSLENLGDIDVQTIAGAMQTGTHGTGARLGGIAQQVVALELVTGTGEVVRIDRHDGDLLDATRVALGAMGVVTEVTLRTLPAHHLHTVARRAPVDDLLADLDAHLADNRHFEFFWIPHTPWAQVKTGNVVDRPPTGRSRWEDFNKRVLENGALDALSRVARRFPAVTPAVASLMARGIATVEVVAESPGAYATPRRVRFQETEWCVPRERFRAAFTAVRELLSTHGRAGAMATHFPVECRFVAADDIWLSPSHGRDVAYIAVHVYAGMPYAALFDRVQAVMAAFDGRPHWGKHHSLTATDLRARYPRFDDWTVVRDRLDPDDVMLSPHLRHLLERDVP